MSWFKRDSTTVLGIDISNSAIKLLVLSKKGAQYYIENHAVVALPQDAVVDKTIMDSDAVVAAIKRAVRESKSKEKNACVAVSGSGVFDTIVQIDADLNPEQMEEEIRNAAEAKMPQKMDDDNLDFEVLGVNKNSSEHVDVLVVMSKRENVENKVDVLQQAGLNAKIVDVEAFAIENAFSLLAKQLPKEKKRKTIAIIDIGATLTALNIISNYRSIYFREQAFGGKQLTKEIERRYNLSYEEAGAKKRHHNSEDGYITEVLEPFKQAIVQQISRALQFFSSSSAAKKVDVIMLAGGCAAIDGLEEMVEKKLKIKTYIANPFAKMAESSQASKKDISKDAPAMLIASGLALRSFD